MNSKDQQIKELRALNDDLENYFSNTIIPQLFIDADLILRKFTPAAIKQFNLTAADVGQPIREVANNVRFPSILENIDQVIRSSAILEKEIQTTDLKWYQMNIIPYIKQKDQQANGVIITFVEITRRIKDLQDLERLIADHETLLDTISHDIKNPITNLQLSVNRLNRDLTAMPDEFKPFLKIIANGVNKLHHIITELTETRKDNQHKYEATSELLNLEHIIEDVPPGFIRDDPGISCRYHLRTAGFGDILFPQKNKKYSLQPDKQCH